MPRRVVRFVVLTLVVLLASLSVSLTAAASAEARVPTCTGFGHLARTEYGFIDNLDEKSGLVPAIDKLICSAADGATIDIKSYFIRVDDPVVARLVSHLALMHRYHQVRVNVHVARNAYPPYRVYQGIQTYAHLQGVFNFAHLYSCMSSCWRAHEGNISHSKWITVSRLRRQADTAILTTSANWSHQQLATNRQTGILTIGHPVIYRALVGRFAVFVDCAVHHRCSRPLPVAHWIGSPGAWIYFAPATADPVADLLSRVHCTPGSHIDVTSLMVTRPTVLRALSGLRQAGCGVRIIVLQPITAAVNQAFHPRCETTHDKSMVITSGNIRTVIAGSEDFGGGGLHGNDNVMLLTSNANVMRTYQSFFNYNWARGKGCQIQG